MELKVLNAIIAKKKNTHKFLNGPTGKKHAKVSTL